MAISARKPVTVNRWPEGKGAGLRAQKRSKVRLISAGARRTRRGPKPYRAWASNDGGGRTARSVSLGIDVEVNPVDARPGDQHLV